MLLVDVVVDRGLVVYIDLEQVAFLIEEVLLFGTVGLAVVGDVDDGFS